MGHTVPHYWARDECNNIGAPVEVMVEFATLLAKFGVPQLANQNNSHGQRVHNIVMRELIKGS
jgi:hypothetical protein